MDKNIEVLNKIIVVKQMDLEECVYELNNRYHSVIVRLAITDYITRLQKELENYNAKLLAADLSGVMQRIKKEKERTI